MTARFKPLFLLPLVMLLASCASLKEWQQTAKPADGAPFTLHKATYNDLPDWRADNIGEAFAAWRKSCDAIAKRPAEKSLGTDTRWGMTGQWQAECAAGQTALDPRAFFETRFTPVLVQGGEGLFTGYYEASIEGSLTRHGPYQTPIYARPADLLVADLGAFLPELKGKTIRGHAEGTKFVPYPDRAGIEAKAPPSEILAYAKDPVDVFFMHIQGSGRVSLDDGSVLRVGYDDQNGRSYVPIGRVLKQRGELTEVSMDTIRQWLATHPDQAQALMNENPSYIFFRKLDNEGGPVGAQGISLTPLRSIAIDKSLFAYGMPFFIQTEAPALNRLMIAQDTGGAIKGAVRADVFWGYGEEAEAKAGPMQSKGRYWVLLPNTVAAALP